MPSIKMRESYSNIWEFNTDSEIWTEWDVQPHGKKRMHHAADIIGSLMLVHGGYSTESKKVMEDFAVLDTHIKKWVPLNFYDN